MIKHLVTINKFGEPIYCYTLEDKELEEWRATQTEEQLKLAAWLEDLQRKDSGDDKIC